MSAVDDDFFEGLSPDVAEFLAESLRQGRLRRERERVLREAGPRRLRQPVEPIPAEPAQLAEIEDLVMLEQFERWLAGRGVPAGRRRLLLAIVRGLADGVPKTRLARELQISRRALYEELDGLPGELGEFLGR